MIAVQALIVGALALVVVLTLLRPEGDDPLFGVSTPDPDTGGPAVERERDDRDGGLALTGPPPPPRDGAPGGAQPQPGGVDFAGGLAAGPAITVPAAPAPSDRDRVREPTADQYDNTLARLAAKLD